MRIESEPQGRTPRRTRRTHAPRIARLLARLALALALGASLESTEALASPPSDIDFSRCKLRKIAKLSRHDAKKELRACTDASGGRAFRAFRDLRRRGRRHDRRPASPGFATAVVAVECPSTLGKPCFDDPAQSIQQAIDHLVEQHPDASRTVLITPGRYVQAFETRHANAGEVHLLGMGSTPYLGAGPVHIVPPEPLPAGAPGSWVFRGAGSVANLSFEASTQPGWRGIVVEGIVLLELDFENINMFGDLGPGARGITLTPSIGFVTLIDSNIVLNCNAGNADTATVYIDREQFPFTEVHVQGGYYMTFGVNNGPGCATFEVPNSPFGDDGHGVALENIHLQCEGQATCFEIDDDDVRLEIGPLVFRRSPSGQFMKVMRRDAVEDGIATSEIFLHGVTRDRGTIQSEWLDLEPKGTMTITGDGPPDMPAFPGWSYRRNDGGPSESVYFGEGSPGPPFRWRPVLTAP